MAEFQNPLNQLFKKEMNRREFLGHLGAGILAMVGVSGLIKGLTEFSGGRSHGHQANGYGSSSYGGESKPAVSTTKIGQ